MQSGAPRADDYPGMLAALGEKLDRRTLAFALGVRPAQLDELAVGRVPDAETGERIRALYRESAGVGGEAFVAAALRPRMKPIVAAIVVADLLIVAIVLLLVLR